MSTIFLDVIKLENPIMFDPKTKEQFRPEDSQYQRLLTEKGIKEEDLEKCFYAIRVMDASGCTSLDPFLTQEEAIEWIKNHLFQEHVYIDGNLRKHRKELEKKIGKEIPSSKIYGWKERIALETESESYVFTIRIPKEWHDKIQEIGKVECRTQNSIAKQAIKEFLERKK